MEKYAKKILKYLNNNHTKIEVKPEFKGNYYSFLTDTIYIAKNFNSKQPKKNVEKINVNTSNLVVTCHECIHSIQSRALHIINTILSNVSLILALVVVLLSVFKKESLVFNLASLSIIVASVALRCVLEMEAINGSTKLALEILQQENIDKITLNDIKQAEEYIKKHKLLALLGMNKDKIIMIVTLLLIVII